MKIIYTMSLFVSALLSITAQNSVTRGVYLQLATPTSMQLAWRTRLACMPVVWLGANPDSLQVAWFGWQLDTMHRAQLNNLQPNTRYYYAIGIWGTMLQGGDSSYYFITPPPLGGSEKIRIWATGDCGTAQATQANTLRSYQQFRGSDYTHLWLLLGDNAYMSGADNEYQTNFFESYMNGNIMRQTAICPAPGNHDYYAAVSTDDRQTAYFKNFSMPTRGELGGEPSNTESYYSYNYGNVHFVSMDSYGTENMQKMYDTTSAQIQWLRRDLAANRQLWTILYWHHPPYTKGSHNSDTEQDLVAIRQKVLPVLERYGVDLVLCGHSHNYERSYFLRNYYANEADFDINTHTVNTSSGRYDSATNACPYIKNTPTSEGIVYVVAGSAGWATTTSAGYPHDAMYYSQSAYGGSLAIDIEGNRLDAQWISESGVVEDQFTMMKNVAQRNQLYINPSQSLPLLASWLGKYEWADNAAAQRLRWVAPAHDTTFYVNDGALGCLADTFEIVVMQPTAVQIAESSHLSVYPSPTQQTLTVAWANRAWSEPATLRIVDGWGRVQFATDFVTLPLTLGIQNLSAGVYWVDIRTARGESIGRANFIVTP